MTDIKSRRLWKIGGMSLQWNAGILISFFTAKHAFHAFKLMYLKILRVYYYVDDSFDLFSAVGLGSWCFHMTLKYEMQVSTDKQL